MDGSDLIDKAFCEKALKNWLNTRNVILKNKTCDWLFFTERLTAIRVHKFPFEIKPMLEQADIPSEKATADCLRQTMAF